MTQYTPVTGAYFERIDDYRYRPTAHTGGGWDPDGLHFSPLGGLLVHEFTRHAIATHPDAGLQLARVSFDILGELPREECEIGVQTVRSGRTIELTEATATIAGRGVVRARAWHLAEFDTSAVSGVASASFPAPHALESGGLGVDWPGGFVESLDVRPIGTLEPGRGSAWIRPTLPLIAGEDVGSLASFVAVVDVANGLCPREPIADWAFPNVDLTIHLHRQPSGPWVGLDTSVAFGPSGLGVTSTILHDLDGVVGAAQQLLTVRPI